MAQISTREDNAQLWYTEQPTTALLEEEESNILEIAGSAAAAADPEMQKSRALKKKKTLATLAERNINGRSNFLLSLSTSMKIKRSNCETLFSFRVWFFLQWTFFFSLPFPV